MALQMSVPDLLLGRSRDVSAPPPATEPLAIPPHHLVTHGVVLGMTGSGKTGLTVVLVEEAIAARVPVLLIDIKGDLTNLFFDLGDASPASFLPWVDADAAARAGKTTQVVAEETAARYASGLAASGLDAKAAAKLRAAMRPRIITPGGRIGEPLDVLSSLSRRSPAWDDDPESAHDQLAAAVSLVLRLAGRDGDPRSRAHVVLSALAERRLSAGGAAPLAELLRDVMTPPVPNIGAMAFEEFLPPRDQQALAQDLNTLLASPKLSTWLVGAPLDVASWMRPPSDGGVPAVVVSVAHLDDDERALVLGLLLDEVLTWVRGLPGTSDLRALVVFDEVFGFLPPAPHNPPTKKPMLALLKQARAFGVGMLVATQNPMDLDYKALSNAGVWFVGRLQTDADRERVVEGLVGADGGTGGLEPGEIGGVLRNLPQRAFFVRDVHRKPVCTLLETRTALSWLRGPMTRRELGRLYAELAPEPEAGPAPATAAPAPVAGSEGVAPTIVMERPSPAGSLAASAPSGVAGSASPVLPATWRSFFGQNGSGARFRPYLAGTVLLRARDAKLGLVVERRCSVIAPFDASGRPDLARASTIDARQLEGPAPGRASFEPLPAGLTTKKGAQAVERALRDHVAASFPIVVDVHRELGLFRADGESPEAFVARCRQQAELGATEAQREIMAKHAPAIAKLEARGAALRNEAAALQQTVASAPSDLGAAFVGFALGRAAGNALSKPRARATAALAKVADAIAKNDAALHARVVERDSALAASVGLARSGAVTIQTERFVPKKADAELVSVGIAWSPVG
jgi:hypothetical protein